jgi:RNA polymerase sigma-70 factor (ECF subfamily)
VLPDPAAFEAQRPAMLALAYRMLGDLARAEDVVQDAWLRWQRAGSSEEIVSPRAFLVKVVTRLCLNELASARARKEESRSDRLPEPVDLHLGGLERADSMDRVSMAFMVVLQRLTPAERAVLLLHDVFDFDHGEIAALLDKTAPACRKLLSRARENVERAKRTLKTSRDEQLRLLRAFLRAATDGDVDALASILAEDATFVADGGAHGVRVGGVRNIPRPVMGGRRVAMVVAALSRNSSQALERRECELNGQPAVIAVMNGRPVFAILLAVADGKIESVFVHADPDRLSHVATDDDG